MKLTPWFHGTIKPVRKGVYMLKDGFRDKIGYQYWNGEHWGVWCFTPQDANRFRRICDMRFQYDQWRGVAK